MTFPTHELTGVVLSFTYMKFSGDYSLYPLILASFSSLFPDIDEPQSKAGRKIPLFSFLVKKLFGHRGATHSLFFLVFSSLLVLGVLYYFDFSLSLVFYFSLGYLGHLLIDLPSARGIPLFWPFSNKYYGLGWVKVEYKRIELSNGSYKYVPSWGERFFQLLLVLLLLYLSYDLVLPFLYDLKEIFFDKVHFDY